MSNITIAELKSDFNIRNKFIEDNMDLVFWIYNKLPKNRVTINDKEDLINEGILGYIEALEHYDENKGVNLNTYAYYWIEKYMYLYLENSNVIKLTPAVLKKITSEEHPSPFVSIDAEFSQEIQEKFCVEESVLDSVESDEINLLLEERLTEIEKKVIHLLYGFNKEDSLPVTKIAESLGTDIYDIYNIRKKAYKKLFQPLKKFMYCS